MPEAPAMPAAPAAPALPETPAAPEFGGGAPPPSLGGGAAEGSLPPELQGGGGGDSGSLELIEDDDSSALTIQEIVNSLVVSASNREETSLTAPAWVITLTAQDITDRGYVELSEVLDDLPGMDIVRPYGDVWFRNYMRGYRNSIGSAFLILIDGVPFNHLWYENTQIMATFPLSNVERVEVLYGPASAVYGPNAAMGVINVVTKKDAESYGTSFRAISALRSPESSKFSVDDLTRILDASAFLKQDDLRVSLTARYEYGMLEPAIGDNYEYTKDQYYGSQRLYGDFVNEESLGGSFRSPNEKLALDGRLFFKNTELAVQFYRLTTGNGSVYAADRAQTTSPITYTEKSAYLRHLHELSSRATSTTMVRYRASNVDSPTTFVNAGTPGWFFVDGADYGVGPDDILVEYSQSQSLNYSITARQDFSVVAGNNLITDGDELLFDLGTKFEHRDLEKSFTFSGVGNLYNPQESFSDGGACIDFEDDGTCIGDSYSFPSPPPQQRFPSKRSAKNNLGGYALAKYKFLDYHWINLGFRVDYRHLIDDVSVGFRGGYVGRFLDEHLNIKLLYGQATQEPTARQLFGYFPGGDLSLDAESSQTLELNVAWVMDYLAAMADIYWVDYDDPIIGDDGNNFENIGERVVVGLDAGIQTLIPVQFMRRLKMWAYYSVYLAAKQSELEFAVDENGDRISPPALVQVEGGGLENIGDLAKHKVMGGITAEFNRFVSATLIGRFISARNTVKSNPVPQIPGFFLLDANILLPDLLADGLTLGARVNNILDTQYFHPGIRTAGAGETPGNLEDTAAAYSGSPDLFNSKLPQPGRAFLLTLALDI